MSNLHLNYPPSSSAMSISSPYLISQRILSGNSQKTFLNVPHFSRKNPFSQNSQVCMQPTTGFFIYFIFIFIFTITTLHIFQDFSLRNVLARGNSLWPLGVSYSGGLFFSFAIRFPLLIIHHLHCLVGSSVLLSEKNEIDGW